MAAACDIVRSLRSAAADGDPVSVARVLDHFDRRSFGAFLAVPALLEITPVGGIPGVPTLLAAIIALFAIQIAWGREDLWLPGLIAARTVGAETLDDAADRLAPAARWADRHFGAHLRGLTAPPAYRVAALAVLGLCLIVPPLELVPFASTLPMATVAAFGIAMLMLDGRLMALAWLASAAALGGVGWLVLRSGSGLG